MSKLSKIVLLALMIMVVAGCGQKEPEQPEPYTLSEEEYERLHELDGPMFMYGHYSNGLVVDWDDYWCGNSFIVYYDGTVEEIIEYNISGTFSSKEEISKEDYITIYEFCRDWMNSDRNGEYDYQGCETDSCGLYFYDESGEENELYYTTYPNDELDGITGIFRNYCNDIEVNLRNYVGRDHGFSIESRFPEELNSGYTFECFMDGTLEVLISDPDLADWHFCILHEEPGEEDYPEIAEKCQSIENGDRIEVKQGDWIYFYADNCSVNSFSHDAAKIVFYYYFE